MNTTFSVRVTDGMRYSIPGATVRMTLIPPTGPTISATLVADNLGLATWTTPLPRHLGIGEWKLEAIIRKDGFEEETVTQTWNVC
jgi:hypothetical protein